MSIIYVLLPISLLLALVGLGAYIWALRSGQFDDLDTPARRVLFDDDRIRFSKLKNSDGDHNGSPSE